MFCCSVFVVSKFYLYMVCGCRNDECVEGGESIVVDALAVVEKLRVTHPHHFSTLVRVPATFNRTHYDRYPHSVLLVYMSVAVIVSYSEQGHEQYAKAT